MSLPIRVNGYSSYKENQRFTELNWTATALLPYQKIDQDLCCIKSTEK